MKKLLISILIFLFLVLFATTHAKVLRIGQGIGTGLQVGGGPGIRLYFSQLMGAIYWTTARADYWADTRGTIWATPRNTEIP